MPPTPYRIAQTSTELKKQHKQNGPRLTERQQKQLERDFQLDQRAARARDAEERRKAAKKKREEKEAKEARARNQTGVGLATQLIGYSHTQAQLKNGMEAFLGLKQKKEEERRKKDLELTKKLEAIAEKIEKEPWDDDDDDLANDLPELDRSFGEQWADDDLDDDSLLEAHDMIMSDPIEEPPVIAPPLPTPAPAPISAPNIALAPSVAPAPRKPVVTKDDPAFIRTHGPINKAIEAALDKLPEPLIELLSQDLSLGIPRWNPPSGLLHKLNPVGIPPHRLRIKVGCVVSLLRDLNTSSQLSKSQHLRVLRTENDRLECLVLDGQLEGTKAFLTRVPFRAKYKNLDQHPFQRTQFPIRVAIDYTPSDRPLPRARSQSGFKLPSVPGRVLSASLANKPVLPAAKAKPQTNQNPSFKIPALPASKSSVRTKHGHTASTCPTPHITQPTVDGWDDFLESGTQIARELANEANTTAQNYAKPPIAASLSIADCLPPMSTQDFDFSLEDLDEDPKPCVSKLGLSQPMHKPAKSLPSPALLQQAVSHSPLRDIGTSNKPPKRLPSTANTSKYLSSSKKIAGKCHQPGPFAAGIDLSALRASQLPKSSTGFHAKRRATASPALRQPPSAKRQRTPESVLVLPIKPVAFSGPKSSCEDFGMSTQDVASFFDDDEVFSFGSPPITV